MAYGIKNLHIHLLEEIRNIHRQTPLGFMHAPRESSCKAKKLSIKNAIKNKNEKKLEGKLLISSFIQKNFRLRRKR